MMNFRVSFSVNNFTEAQIRDWYAWVMANINSNNDLLIEEVPNASDAEDRDSPAQRIRPKRVGR